LPATRARKAAPISALPLPVRLTNTTSSADLASRPSVLRLGAQAFARESLGQLESPIAGAKMG
jgi:hypothetical protein